MNYFLQLLRFHSAAGRAGGRRVSRLDYKAAPASARRLVVEHGGERAEDNGLVFKTREARP